MPVSDNKDVICLTDTDSGAGSVMWGIFGKHTCICPTDTDSMPGGVMFQECTACGTCTPLPCCVSTHHPTRSLLLQVSSSTQYDWFLLLMLFSLVHFKCFLYWPHTDCNNNRIFVSPHPFVLITDYLCHPVPGEPAFITLRNTPRDTCTHTCTHDIVHVCTHAYAYSCIHAHMYAHTCTCTRACMHTHKHTHTTNTCTPVIGGVDKRRKKTTISVHHSVDLDCTVW